MKHTRQIRLTVGPAGQAGRVLDSRPPTGVGLHLACTVRRSDAGEADVRCTAWGVGDSTLSALQGATAATVVEAGYDGALTTIARGLVVPGSVEVTREGKIAVVSWQVSDGVLDLRRVRLSRSWSQTDARAVLAYILEQVPDLVEGVITLGREHTWTRGLVVADSARTVLDLVARDTRSRWEIVGGALHMWPIGGQLEVRRVRVEVDTGLRSCERAADGTWDVVTLAELAIRPGDVVSVRARSYSGSLTVTAVEHALDSGYAQPFDTSFVGRP